MGSRGHLRRSRQGRRVALIGHEEFLSDVVLGYGEPLDVAIIRGWHAFRRLTSIRWLIEHGHDASSDVATLHHAASE